MINLEDFIKKGQMIDNIANSLSLSSQLPRILNTEGLINNLTGASVISEFIKSMEQPLYSYTGISSTFEIIKSMNRQSRLLMPSTALEAIMSINRQHEKIFENFNYISKAIHLQPHGISQFKNLYSALSHISSNIATIAIQQNNWMVLDDYESITEQTLDFTEALHNESAEHNERLFQTLLASVLSFYNKYKSAGISAMLIIDILLRCTDIHQYLDFIEDKPEAATQLSIDQLSHKQDSTIHFIRILNKHLKDVKEYRITNRSCKVMIKPKLKSITITNLPEAFEVIVIQVHHKWVYVSYFDPIDDLPQTGWILKKYLNKPE